MIVTVGFCLNGSGQTIDLLISLNAVCGCVQFSWAPSILSTGCWAVRSRSAMAASSP